MVREVECKIRYKTDTWADEDTIYFAVSDDDELCDICDISDIIEEKVDSYIRDNGVFDDLIQDAIDQCDAHFDCEGTINIFSVGDLLYKAAKDYINSCTLSVNVSVADRYIMVESMEIDIKAILQDMIDERNSCEQWNCDIGGAVESLLDGFSAGGYWHAGFRTNAGKILLLDTTLPISFDKSSGQWKNDDEIVTPILWFGYDEPMKLWTIDENIDAEGFLFWFVEDEYDSLHRVVLGSNDGCFDTWYFAECARAFPSIKDIMSRCPIAFEERDTLAMIKQRINNYFVALFGQK